MRPTVLHVEDDPYLATFVQTAFRRLGFGGTLIRAETVRTGLAAARRCHQDGIGPDLVLVDLQLPDGTGLDLVRQVRSSPYLSSTPVIVLSGQEDPETVGLAYALGANCFVSKNSKDNSILESLELLYDFWLKEALLPGPGATPRGVVEVAIKLRHRAAEIYGQLAHHFVAEPAIARFWLNLFLHEENFANLLTFFSGQWDDRELPPDLLGRLRDSQERRRVNLEQVHARLDEDPFPTNREALLLVAKMTKHYDASGVSESLATLFAKGPVMAQAIADLLARHWIALAERFEQEQDCPDLLRTAGDLRRRLESIAKHNPPPSG